MAEDLKWYILQVKPGSENRVVELLRNKISVEHMEEMFGEIINPTEEVVEMKGGQKKTSERKIFPGYVLIMMQMNDQTWHLVKSINVAQRYVLGFVGGGKPTPITNQEADRILQRVREGVDKPRPKTLFEPGEVVRVTEGPFADFNGVVEDVNYEKNRLRVAVLIFGRSTPVELEFSQVEKS
jgi:transcription termination/antitermination protein NusG